MSNTCEITCPNLDNNAVPIACRKHGILKGMHHAPTKHKDCELSEYKITDCGDCPVYICAGVEGGIEISGTHCTMTREAIEKLVNEVRK